MREASSVIRNARRALRTATGQRKGRLHRAINHLGTIVGRTERVVAQARSRLSGVMPESASRLVSLHDVDARPIRKGRLGKPVEFGYKAQIVDNADGVILDHNVEIGTRQTPPSWPRRSHGSPDAPDAHRARSPPTAATAKHRWNATCTNSAYAAWRSRAKANPAPRAASSNTAEPSATRSNGAPDPKDGSTTSNEATAGTAPNSPASAEPEAGADTASSLTTSSRSGPSPHETHTRAARADPTATPNPSPSR